MISIEQIKAARALLDWTQEQLAKESGLSKPSINTLERRLANPKVETIDSIQRALEKAGVAFTDGPGVKLKSSVLKTQILEGEDSLIRLNYDIAETLKGTKENLMIAGVSEEKYRNLGGGRVLDIIKKRLKMGIKTQILSCEGDQDFIEPIEHYRWIPKAFFSRTPYYIYGNKYAIFLWGPPKKVVIIENAEIADSYRQQFLAHWNAAKKPTKKGEKN